MAKTKVSQWDSTAANNTDINSININEGCPPSTINNAIRELMAQVKDWQDGSSGDGWTSSGTVTSSGTLAITGNLTLDGASGTSGQYLTSAGSGSTPTWTTITFPTAFTAGMIMMWSGTIASIPSGWVLCDGTSSTPDLRNRFVIGAHSDSGGAAKTTVTGSSTLSGGSKDAIVVSHTHTATSSSENEHNHTYDKAGGSTKASGSAFDPNVFTGHTSTNTSTVAAHNHTITVSSAGSSGTDANLPPYYALAYIMKT